VTIEITFSIFVSLPYSPTSGSFIGAGMTVPHNTLFHVAQRLQHRGGRRWSFGVERCLPSEKGALPNVTVFEKEGRVGAGTEPDPACIASLRSRESGLISEGSS
jgi:hypothetical protein